MLLFAILATAIAIRLLFFVGTRGGDDLRHAYHGYFLFDTAEAKHAVVDLPDGTVFRRMGINLLIWLATRVFGVHEWTFALVPLTGSLIGLVAMYLLLRRVAGRAAGLTAATMWALMPADAGNATLLLPDSMFAGLLALFLFLMVSAYTAERWSFPYAVMAGMVLGYLQYVKRSAMVLIPPLIALEVYAWWRTRKLRGISLYACLGFAIAQIAFGSLFWHLKGDFWWYWQQTLAVSFARLGQDNHATIEILGSFQRFFITDWALGGAVAFLPIALPVALLDRRVPARMFLAVMLATQTFILWQAWRMIANQERYTLLVSPLVVAFLLLGLFSLLGRLTPGWRRFLTMPACLVLLAATAWPLESHARQRSRKPFEAHWLAYRYLNDTAEPGDKIYGKPREGWTWGATLRAMYQFNQFRKFKGGFDDLANAYDAKSGWAIISYHETRAPSGEPYDIPDNWLEVYHAGRGKRWVRVFKILPEPLGVKPRLFITRPHPPVAPPDTSGYSFRQIPLPGPPGQYKSHWVGKSEAVVVQVDEAGLRCEVQAAADPKSRNYGGLRIPASQMEALRLQASFIHPENLAYVYVDAYDQRRRRLARWRWVVRKNACPPEEPATYVFVPGEPIGFFQVLEANLDRPVAEAHLFLRVRPGQKAGVVIHRAEIAVPDQGKGIEAPR